MVEMHASFANNSMPCSEHMHVDNVGDNIQINALSEQAHDCCEIEKIHTLVENCCDAECGNCNINLSMNYVAIPNTNLGLLAVFHFNTNLPVVGFPETLPTGFYIPPIA